MNEHDSQSPFDMKKMYEGPSPFKQPSEDSFEKTIQSSVPQREFSESSRDYQPSNQKPAAPQAKTENQLQYQRGDFTKAIENLFDPKKSKPEQVKVFKNIRLFIILFIFLVYLLPILKDILRSIFTSE